MTECAFREDIGQNVHVGDLEGLSGKQQRLRLEGIKQACQLYIQGQLRERLNRQIEAAFRETGVAYSDVPVIEDPDDADRQTLLVRYPSVSADGYEYMKPAVKMRREPNRRSTRTAQRSFNPMSLTTCRRPIS